MDCLCCDHWDAEVDACMWGFIDEEECGQWEDDEDES